MSQRRRLNTGVAVAVADPIVYVALETVLSKKPLATAIAWIVVVVLTGMGAVYSVDDFVGACRSSCNKSSRQPKSLRSSRFGWWDKSPEREKTMERPPATQWCTERCSPCWLCTQAQSRWH